jgi:DHA2 family multidrug resistance protein-like MFS transporter
MPSRTESAALESGTAPARATLVLAGTPASHSLTGSVPVRRAGMASGTADLQRDLGGALMQSVLGAVHGGQVSSDVQSELTKSFAGAEKVAQQHPSYSDQIVAAAKSSFLQGDDWAYTAGIIAVLIGAVLVYFFFPRRDDEQRLLRRYHTEDRKV